MGDDLVIVLEFHPEGGVGEQFGHYPRKFQHFFLRHKASFGVPQIGAENGRGTRQNQGGLLARLSPVAAVGFAAAIHPFIGGSACAR
jgi:hypothetical protein